MRRHVWLAPLWCDGLTVGNVARALAGGVWAIYLDTMENQALRPYNSWPIRLYLIRNGKIIFTGAQGPFETSPRR